MPNLWDLITNKSTLPVQSGNSLWLHFNNLGSGSIGGLIPIPYSELVLQDEVAVLTVSDYSDTIEIIEVEIPTFIIIEELATLSFEE